MSFWQPIRAAAWMSPAAVAAGLLMGAWTAPAPEHRPALPAKPAPVPIPTVTVTVTPRQPSATVYLRRSGQPNGRRSRPPRRTWRTSSPTSSPTPTATPTTAATPTTPTAISSATVSAPPAR